MLCLIGFFIKCMVYIKGYFKYLLIKFYSCKNIFVIFIILSYFYEVRILVNKWGKN